MQCRSCLLNPMSLSEIENKPEVYLLISPLSATQEDLKCGFMNQVLTSTCNLNLACIDLETGKVTPKSSVKAQFLIVHIGMVNFLVKFSPSASVSIPSQYLINPNGGQYSVPAEENRRGILPKGVWAAFECMAREFEKSWYEHLNKPYLSVEKQGFKIFPDAKIAETHGMISGLLQELNISSLGPMSHDELKSINLLPELFHIRSKKHFDDVILPEGHRILLHHTFSQNNQQGKTLFLAVGQTGKFSLEMPYVLWHTYEPGLQTNFAFFISTQDLKGTELMSGNKEKFFVKNPNFDTKAAMIAAPRLLKELLHSKGFFNIKSLLCRLKR